MCFIDITDSLILMSYNFQHTVCHNKEHCKSKIRFELSSATRKRFSSCGLWPGHSLALLDLFASRDPRVVTRLDFHSNVRLANAP